MEQEKLTYYYAQYHKVLFYHALRIVSSAEAAEDIVQDVFLDFCGRYDGLRKDENDLKNYLYKSTHNKSLDILRSSHTKDVSLVATDEELGNYVYAFLSADDVLFGDELKSEINRAVASLPDKCREVFVMSRKDEMKNREIAEALHIDIKTVEKHISKALSLIRAHLEETGYLTLLIWLFK